MAEQSGHTNLRQLPQAGDIQPEDFILVETPNGTHILEFKNLLISEDNITFNNRLSSYDSGIESSISRTSSVTAAIFGGGENILADSLSAIDGLSAGFLFINQAFISGGDGVKLVGPLSSNQDITAFRYYGDGSNLTNLPTASSGGGWVRPTGGIVRLNTLTDKVGIGTTAPAYPLTVAGSISAQSIVFVGQEYNTGYNGGDSRQWVSTYETVKSASATWESSPVANSISVYSTTNTYSGHWHNVFNQVFNLSATWYTTYIHMGYASGNWESSSTEVFNNSAIWASTHSDVKSNSSYWSDANWQSVYSTMTAYSARWDGVWSVFGEVSALYDNVYDSFESSGSGANTNAMQTLTAVWQSVATDVYAGSADWNLGGDWQFVLEDGDGTEATINQGKEVKFVEGNAGINIDFTDLDNGTDGDPYDLTFDIPFYSTVQSESGYWDQTVTTVRANSGDWESYSFKTVTLSGQNNAAAIGPDVIADSSADTLTLSAGPNIALISDPTTDTVTISSVGGDGGGSGNTSKYSTGWVSSVGGTTVADEATLTVTHNLNTTDVIVAVYGNSSASDSGAQEVTNQQWPGTSGFFYGAFIVTPSANSVIVQLAAQGYVTGSTDGDTPATVSWDGDYIKIVVIG